MTDGDDAVRTLLDKANRALLSARVLLADDDVDGACNRAYYAVFDAARGALASLDPVVDPDEAKTHRGVMSVFDARLVRTGIVPRDLGRLFRRIEGIRLVGDYRTGSVEPEDAVEAVENADRFVAAMRSIVASDTGDPPSE